MNGFFRDPTPENYNTVFEFLTSRGKKPETHLWMLSARKFHGVGEPLTEKRRTILFREGSAFTCRNYSIKPAVFGLSLGALLHNWRYKILRQG